MIEKGLSPYQALLHAIWSDERIATCCVSMRNIDQIRENAQAAATFEPMKQTEIDQLQDACLAAGPTFCADCDGRCARAAGTEAALGDLTRLLTYHDQYGYRGEARRLYAALPESPELAGRRPRSRAAGLPQPPRLRVALAAGRSPPGLNIRLSHSRGYVSGRPHDAGPSGLSQGPDAASLRPWGSPRTTSAASRAGRRA